MADGVFNTAKGRAIELIQNNTDSLQIVLLKENEAEADLIDHQSLDAVLGASGNTEADFNNYSRKTGLSETITFDTTNEKQVLDVPDVTWDSAGGNTSNDLTKAILAVQTGADDTTLIPIAHYDFPVRTDGSDLTLKINSDGAYEAT